MSDETAVERSPAVNVKSADGRTDGRTQELIPSIASCMAMMSVNAMLYYAAGQRSCAEGRVKCVNSGRCVDERLFCAGLISCNDDTTVEDVCRKYLRGYSYH